MENNNKSNRIMFSALYPYEQNNITLPTEKEVRGQDWYSWGDRNEFPMYLSDLVDNVPTLASIIKGTRDYVLGNEIVCDFIGKNKKEISKIVNQMALSYLTYGCIYINVLRNHLGKVADIKVLDARKVRTDKQNEFFWYSEDFVNNKSYGRIKAIKLPKFEPNAKDASSIYYFKTDEFRTYGKPIYSSALRACEVERKIDDFQLNEISNSFSGSYIINFNNGQPTDEIREEIERNINEKFSGSENGGRIMVSFNDSTENAVTIEKIESTDFADKYNSVANRSREQIFTAFRACPELFGLGQNTKGFAEANYKDAFTLYDTTVIRPIQRTIIESLEFIYGVEDKMVIEPFQITFNNEN